MANDVGSQSESSDGARNALASIGSARRRLDAVPPPRWLFGGLGMCMLVEAIVVLLFTGALQSVLLVLVLVAIFVVTFAAQRRSGVVTRVTGVQSLSPRKWIALIVIIVPCVALGDATGAVGLEWLWFLVLAVVIAVFGPRLRRLSLWLSVGSSDESRSGKI